MKTPKKELPSSRKYVVAFIEGSANCQYFPTLAEILDDSNAEWKYAIQEDFDKLLDLKVGERMMMQFNRDNTDSTGFIKRVA